MDEAHGKAFTDGTGSSRTFENDSTPTSDTDLPRLTGFVFDFKFNFQFPILGRQFEFVRSSTGARTGLDDIRVFGRYRRYHQKEKGQEENAKERARKGGCCDLHRVVVVNEGDCLVLVSVLVWHLHLRLGE